MDEIITSQADNTQNVRQESLVEINDYDIQVNKITLIEDKQEIQPMEVDQEEEDQDEPEQEDIEMTEGGKKQSHKKGKPI